MKESVTYQAIVEEGSVYAGVPAKKVKSVSPEVFAQNNMRIANNYVMYAEWFKEG